MPAAAAAPAEFRTRSFAHNGAHVFIALHTYVQDQCSTIWRTQQCQPLKQQRCGTRSQCGAVEQSMQSSHNYCNSCPLAVCFPARLHVRPTVRPFRCRSSATGSTGLLAGGTRSLSAIRSVAATAAKHRRLLLIPPRSILKLVSRSARHCSPHRSLARSLVVYKQTPDGVCRPTRHRKVLRFAERDPYTTTTGRRRRPAVACSWLDAPTIDAVFRHRVVARLRFDGMVGR